MWTLAQLFVSPTILVLIALGLMFFVVRRYQFLRDELRDLRREHTALQIRVDILTSLRGRKSMRS